METKPNLGTPNRQDVVYIEALKTGDSKICHQFFYHEIGGILHKIRIEIFSGLIEFDEMVSELYLFLSRSDWSKLNGFDGRNGCRLRTWMIPVAWRFFISARERLVCNNGDAHKAVSDVDAFQDDLHIQIAIDVNAVLARMPNRRYANIIRQLLVEGYSAQDLAEMFDMRVENIYNLKHRAIAQFIAYYGRR